jgi:hypothetical protein
LCFSLDDPVRPEKNRLWNRQAYLLRLFKVDDELKLRRLLDETVSRLGAFQNLVNEYSGAPIGFGLVGAVRQATSVDKISPGDIVGNRLFTLGPRSGFDYRRPTHSIPRTSLSRPVDFVLALDEDYSLAVDYR